MHKPTKAKLRLDRTTIATLTPGQLAVPVGGRPPDTLRTHCGDVSCGTLCSANCSVLMCQ